MDGEFYSCVLCHKLDNLPDTNLCSVCKEKVDQVNLICYLKSLLKECYDEVATIKLREKIEKVLGKNHGI